MAHKLSQSKLSKWAFGHQNSAERIVIDVLIITIIVISVISFPIILLRARRSHDGKSAKWVAGKWFILIFRPAGLIIPELLIWVRMINSPFMHTLTVIL